LFAASVGIGHSHSRLRTNPTNEQTTQITVQ